MFSKKELTWIIIIIFIFEFILALNFDKSTGYLVLDLKRPQKFLVPILIIFISIIAKKIAAPYYSIKIEHSGWKIQRFGYYTRSYFKKPFPIGIVLPFFMAFFSLSFVKPLIFLQFDAENDPRKRIQKHHGDIKFRKVHINESDLNLTAFWGFFSLIILAVIGIIINIYLKKTFNADDYKNIYNIKELAFFPLYYCFWNLFPWENTDGLKILVANFFTWIFLVFLSIIVLIFAFLLIF
jgi:hypothetical protein